jgi:starch synthase (maltosyl-transferring)
MVPFNMQKTHQKKNYQDILPIYFETDWKNLWKELLRIALYWVEI